MAEKVKLRVKLNLEHDLGYDHFQTWQSQLEMAFQLHDVADSKPRYLAAAANLDEQAAHYLWQRYSAVPDETPYEALLELFQEYFSSTRSNSARLATLFAIAQQEGESVQAFRHRVQKEMRTCNLTKTAKLEEVVEAVTVHLFARGLSSAAAKQRVLETGDKTLADAAVHAQAVVLSTETRGISSDSTPVFFTNQLPPPTGPVRQEHKCSYCGRTHPPGRKHCPAASQTCQNCGKRGHFRAVCRSPAQAAARAGATSTSTSAASGYRRSARGTGSTTRAPAEQYTDAQTSAVHHVVPTSTSSGPSAGSDTAWAEAYSVLAVAGKTGFALPTILIEIDDQHKVPMRVDSGSCVSILPQSRVPPGYQLQPPSFHLQPLGIGKVKPVGAFQASLRWGSRQCDETMFVIADDEMTVPALIGERASLQLGLLSAPVQAVVGPHQEETQALPAMKGAVTIGLAAEVPPTQQSARRLAPALLPSLRNQLNTWLDQGVVEMVPEVDPTDFVSPLVPVSKTDKTIRWCVDLRQVNQAVKRPGIQLPTADDLLSQLGGATVFSKIDLKTGYSQLKITPESRRAFVVASPLGYFRFRRLPFGVSSGPEMFQQKMEQILAECNGIVIYLDDILVFGHTQAEHDQRLEAVRAALKANNVTIHPTKSIFNQKELGFLGHQISSEGLGPDPKKIEALEHMDDPCNVAELRAFLGFVTYLAKFLPNMATISQPLTALLSQPWSWTTACAEATQTIRKLLMQQPVLALFDPRRPTRVEVDASGAGLGAVLLQQVESADSSSQWRPVYYASRKLSPPESRYAAIEKETLAVSWGVNRFRGFLTGMSFTVITDHKPLVQVYKPTYNLGQANIRVQRLVLKSQDLEFQVVYRPGSQNNLADPLSRLPTAAADTDFLVVHHVTQDSGLATSQRQRIAELTATDSTLNAVRQALQSGQWPATPDVAPYRALQAELSVWPFPDTNDFVLYRGTRLVIPNEAVANVIQLAHDGHPGRDKTLNRLKESVWWPGWSKATRNMLAQCPECLVEAQVPQVPLKMRKLPPTPWHTVSVDIFYYRQMPFLSLIDVYSRYPAVVQLRTETSSAVIEAIDQIFSLFGLPRHMITDNGRQFCSTEFEDQLREWNVTHERTVPYTPDRIRWSGFTRP